MYWGMRRLDLGFGVVKGDGVGFNVIGFGYKRTVKNGLGNGHGEDILAKGAFKLLYSSYSICGMLMRGLMALLGCADWPVHVDDSFNLFFSSVRSK